MRYPHRMTPTQNAKRPLQRPPQRPSQRPWSQPLADLIGGVIDPVLTRQGFGQSDIILYWDDIVGERLAAQSQPMKLQWPPRGTSHMKEAVEPATLVVRVESGFALELQHLSGLVIERVNAHLGWYCVGRLALRQGPLLRRNERRLRAPPLDCTALARAEARVGEIADTPLRSALIRLGARVLERS